jgi:hypothetical protein
MVEEDKYCFIESVDGVDEDAYLLPFDVILVNFRC